MNKVNQMLQALLNGNKRPYWSMRIADDAGIPYWLMCAVLEKESAGGQNIFGHDPTIFVGAGGVTKAKYLNYKKERDRLRKPDGTIKRRMQGVGPMQLCVSPDTKILTSELLWQRADEVTPSTEIMAFDEYGADRVGTGHQRRRFFETAVVEEMKIEEMQRLLVSTTTSDIVVTPNHQFMVYFPEKYRWVRADELVVGNLIASVPVHEDTPRMCAHRPLKACHKSEVLSIQPLEDGPMVAHRTSTGTLITNGLLSHNTWWEYQDRADALGGCWAPKYNMIVGAQLLKKYMDKFKGDIVAVGKAYNGSTTYGQDLLRVCNKWKRIFNITT